MILQFQGLANIFYALQKFTKFCILENKSPYTIYVYSFPTQVVSLKLATQKIITTKIHIVTYVLII